MDKRKDLQFSLMSQSDFIGQSNVDIEEIVLGAFVNFPESYFKVADQLSIREFSTTETRYIYLAIKELSEVSKIDIATVTDKLMQKKYVDIMMQQKKGFDLVLYLNDMCERIDSDYHLNEHVSILNGYAKRRELTTLSDEIRADCNNQVDPSEVINKISDKIVDIQEMGDVVEFDLSKANKDVLNSWDKKIDTDKSIKTYIENVDRFLYCIEPTELVIVAAAPSMGKEQSINSKILTPKGWDKLGNIKIGDKVCTPDGKNDVVIGVYPQGVKPLYRIIMQDGSETLAGLEHLWLTQTINEKKKNINSIKTTKQIIETLKEGKINKRNNHFIPFINPIQFDYKEIKINPWLLGAYLGDGYGGVMFSNTEKDVVKKFESLIDTKLTRRTDNDFYIHKGEFYKSLNEYKLTKCRSQEKFIPESYMNNSINVRLEILRGLLDTDGYVDQDTATIEYSTTSPYLKEQVKEIVMSLGGRCTISERNGVYSKNDEKIITQLNYRLRISFHNDIIPVSSKKHLSKYKGPNKYNLRAIQDIIYSHDEEAVCIMLSKKPNLYITDDYIITHNTSFALEIFKNQIINEVPTAFFSLEMGTTQLLNRMYAVEAEVELSKMRSRVFSNDERTRLAQAMGGFEDKKFWIDDKSRKISHIANKIRKFVIRHKVKLVLIDYLQLMTCDIGKTGNREQEVSVISRTLKELASELEIPIIALSQINRAIHSRSDKRPTLGDLRESGAIEQDADIVAFVHRPAYFNITNGIPDTEHAEIIFAKGRSTGIGTVEVAYKSKFTKFISVNKDSYQQLKDEHFKRLDPNYEFDNG